MWIVILFILTFIPMINISFITIPSIALLLPLFIFKKKVLIDTKFTIASLISASSILILSLINVFLLNNEGFSSSETLYFSIILMNLIVYTIFSNINISKDKIVKTVKIFLIIQLIFCLMQRFNILGTNELLESLYFHWQSINAQKDNLYLEVSYRSFGTMGNPVYLSVISFYLANIVRYFDNNKKYYYLTFVIMLLAGSRTSILAFLLIEIIDLFRSIYNKENKALKTVTLVFVLLITGYISLPFFRNFIDSLMNLSFLNDYSVTYRLDMVDLLINNKNNLIGGNLISNLPNNVDSEYILRILQYGIIGLFAIIYPYIVIFKNRYFSSKNKVIIINVIIFTLISMFTNVILTNMMIASYLLLFLVSIYKEGDKL